MGFRRGRLFLKDRTRSRKPGLDSSKILVLGFALLILLGAVLLCLPISSRDGTPTPFLNALFTATSATCVTGLVTYDTALHWNAFGSAVIICLIQIGGLGFMTFATLFSLILRRSVSYREKLDAAASLNLSDSGSFSSLILHIVRGTFLFEGCGAVILAVRFMKDFGFVGGLLRGMFVSISAFCNAGFDLMGTLSPGSSLGFYRGDLSVNLTVMLLVFIGGLGFPVWEEIFSGKSPKRYSLYTRIVLWGSGILFLFGVVSFALLEYIRPESLADATVGEKIFMALFNSVTLRTAGFATVDYGALKELTKAVCILLMFVGGASGSTAGGVKVSTVAVLFLAVGSVIRNRTRVTVGGRRIPERTVFRALTLVCLAIMITLLSAFFLAAGEKLPLIDTLFESVSAFCTVGLTTGITPTLSSPSLLLLIGLMFFGRVGFLTVTCALFPKSNKELLEYPEQDLTIG